MAATLTPEALESLMANRNALLDELHSDSHYENTETITYGNHDPFSIPVMKCDKCGGEGVMQHSVHPANGRPQYFIRCNQCGNFYKTFGRNPELAALLWNMINPKGLRYTDFPMFGLAPLTPELAKKRMIGIRRNLEIRENLARIESVLNPVLERRPPSHMYKRRLSLYLHWTMWAQAAIRTELPPKYRKLMHERGLKGG